MSEFNQQRIERTYEYIQQPKEGAGAAVTPSQTGTSTKPVQHQQHVYTTGTSPMYQQYQHNTQNYNQLQQPIGNYYIRSRLNGMVLDAKNEGTKEGTEVIMYPLKYSSNQQFRFESTGVIRNIHNGYVLDYVHGMHGMLKGGFHWPGQVILTSYTGQQSQHWEWSNGQLKNMHGELKMVLKKNIYSFCLVQMAKSWMSKVRVSRREQAVSFMIITIVQINYLILSHANSLDNCFKNVVNKKIWLHIVLM